MKHLITDKRPPRSLTGWLQVLIVPAALAATTLSEPATAQPSDQRSKVVMVSNGELRHEASLRRIRRQIAFAAQAVCSEGGISSIYSNTTRRCRQLTVANAERQLREKIAHRELADDLAQTAGGSAAFGGSR